MPFIRTKPGANTNLSFWFEPGPTEREAGIIRQLLTVSNEGIEVTEDGLKQALAYYSDTVEQFDPTAENDIPDEGSIPEAPASRSRRSRSG
jgi:hypothetical protein